MTRRTALTGLLVCLLVVLCGCGGQEQGSVSPIAIGSAAPQAAPSEAGGGSAAIAAGESDAAPVDGLEVRVPSIGARSSLIPLQLNPDRTIQTPPVATPQQAGLYARGPQPGDAGPAVILGHINGGGTPGVFARLAAVRAGDRVEVQRADGRQLEFAVYRTVEVDKTAFPTSAVYSDTPGPELRLISCGGALNPAARSYDSNSIVFARQV